MTDTTYPCTRCAGTGTVTQHRNVLGGVCFRCKGSGKQAHKPGERAPKWAVFGHHRQTGECTRLYNVHARTADAAIKRASTIMAQASAEWRNTYTLERARALRWDELADESALTWEAATAGQQEHAA